MQVAWITDELMNKYWWIMKKIEEVFFLLISTGLIGMGDEAGKYYMPWPV